MSPTSVSCILYVGLDVHKDWIVSAVLRSDETTPSRVDKIVNDPAKLRRYFARLAETGEIHACYEASGAGYVLQRAMQTWGYHCDVIAPSLIPHRPGHQRKHDRYDAKQLAHYYRSGDLTAVRIPSAAEERVRDLVRCRTTFQRELIRARHYILKFLTRRGLRYTTGKAHWTGPHHAWLDRLERSEVLAAQDMIVFREYVALMKYARQRRDALDQEIAAVALTPAIASAVGRLSCFRGIDRQAAMVLTTEIVDWRRFAKPTQLMAFVGLVPRENSTGPTEIRGSITKAGNSYCRHVLIQAAWTYRHSPRVSSAIGQRQRGQPPSVITHAWKAQHRLHKLYNRLTYRKRPQVAAVAVARELVGFLWAVMRDCPAVLDSPDRVEQAA